MGLIPYQANNTLEVINIPISPSLSSYVSRDKTIERSKNNAGMLMISARFRMPGCEVFLHLIWRKTNVSGKRYMLCKTGIENSPADEYGEATLHDVRICNKIALTPNPKNVGNSLSVEIHRIMD